MIWKAAMCAVCVFTFAEQMPSLCLHPAEARTEHKPVIAAADESLLTMTTAVATTMQTTSTTTAVTTTTAPVIPTVSVSNAAAEAASVSSVRITWDTEEGREYEISWETDALFPENITFLAQQDGLCYLTGLRADSEYHITVTPVLHEDEKADIKAASLTVRTPSVEVIEEFPYEAGWTSCFAGERASGLTAMPSSGAISGSYADDITGTGIRRFENGDYACAMGLFYGQCNDRFLVELANGIQFTVRICDSKGWADDADMDSDGDGAVDCEGDGVPDGRFHWFAHGGGKCVIEFVYDDRSIPQIIWTYGSWGCANWNGLNLCSDIASIQKINY